MFLIKRNNRRYGNKTFDSYEQARSYVRKKMSVEHGIPHKQVALSDYGFAVVQA